MSTRFAGASLIAVLFLAGAPAAMAADLSGDPYDDPRYADIYRDGPPRQAKRYVERYEERDEERGQSYKDDGYKDDGYKDDDYDNGSRYGDRGDDYDDGKDDKYDGGYRYGDNRGGCVPRHLIRRDLKDQGWHGFHALQVRHNYILLKAQRPSGRVFDLKVDRCTGHIVNAKACDAANYGRYAYDPRRHYRY